MLDKTTQEHMVIVAEELDARGIKYYNLQPGNNCIWASWGSSSCPVNAYYFFQNNQIVDVQYD